VGGHWEEGDRGEVGRRWGDDDENFCGMGVRGLGGEGRSGGGWGGAVTQRGEDKGERGGGGWGGRGGGSEGEERVAQGEGGGRIWRAEKRGDRVRGVGVGVRGCEGRGGGQGVEKGGCVWS